MSHTYLSTKAEKGTTAGKPSNSSQTTRRMAAEETVKLKRDRLQDDTNNTEDIPRRYKGAASGSGATTSNTHAALLEECDSLLRGSNVNNTGTASGGPTA